MYTKKMIIWVWICCAVLGISSASAAGVRFSGNWRKEDSTQSGIATCQDTVRRCVESGMKEMDGIRETRPCWQYSYVKSCNFPSKNDCRLYEHCYALGDKQCFVRDYANTCVNMEKEFSCKSWEPVDVRDETARMGLEAKEGPESLVCEGVPCIDGNCVDKSYETNGEMMDSISRLHAAKFMKPGADKTFDLFKANDMHCSKKPAGYTNCCNLKKDGWGTHLGAGCTKDEQILAEQRGKELCVFATKITTEKTPFHISKHYYCCFNNMLDKVIQVQGRKQLGRKFVKSDGTADCGGFSLEEIEKIDFNKINFREFIEDFQKKFIGGTKASNTGDITTRIQKQATEEIRTGNNDTSDKDNNLSGWHQSVSGGGYESDTEGRDDETIK